MAQTFRERGGLDVRISPGNVGRERLIRRDEGRARQGRSQQLDLLHRERLAGQRELDDAVVSSGGPGGEGVVPDSLVHHALDVYVADDHLGVEVEALRLGQDDAILRDQRVPGPHQIGGRFAGTGPRVEVGCEATRRLLAHQVAAIFDLTQQFVAGRAIEEEGRAGQGHVAAGWVHGPQILANLDADDQVGEISRGEEQIVPDGDLLAVDLDAITRHQVAGGEPAFLVEFVGGRQIGLGDEAEHASAGDEGRAVEQLAADLQRQAHDRRDIVDRRSFDNGLQACLRRGRATGPDKRDRRTNSR